MELHILFENCIGYVPETIGGASEQAYEFPLRSDSTSTAYQGQGRRLSHDTIVTYKRAMDASVFFQGFNTTACGPITYVVTDSAKKDPQAISGVTIAGFTASIDTTNNAYYEFFISAYHTSQP